MSQNISIAKVELVPGSLYQKENADFIDQTTALAEKIYFSILRDPALKKNPIKKQAKEMYENMLALMLAINGRRRDNITSNKRRLAAEEDGWILDDEKYIEGMALVDIAQEDMRAAWPKMEFCAG